MFQCKCIKCGVCFNSEDECDYDGEAFCPECIEKNKLVAAKVDAIIANRREARKGKATIPMFDYKNIKKGGKVNYMNI